MPGRHCCKFRRRSRSSISGNAATSDSITGELGFIGTSEHGFYSVGAAFNGDNNQTYTATAKPVAGKGQDADEKCMSFTIDHADLRGAAGSAAAESWR